MQRVVKKLPQRFTKDDFVQTQKVDRFCSKCKQVPYSPQRSKCCNLLYCDVCSPKVTKCPKCKGTPPQLSFNKDSELSSKIQKVKIKCPNRGRGCTWKGEVYKLKKHLLAGASGASECIAIKGKVLTAVIAKKNLCKGPGDS